MALQELPLPVVHLGSSREEKRSVALALLLVFTHPRGAVFLSGECFLSRLFLARAPALLTQQSVRRKDKRDQKSRLHEPMTERAEVPLLEAERFFATSASETCRSPVSGRQAKTKKNVQPAITGIYWREKGPCQPSWDKHTPAPARRGERRPAWPPPALHRDGDNCC